MEIIKYITHYSKCERTEFFHQILLYFVSFCYKSNSGPYYFKEIYLKQSNKERFNIKMWGTYTSQTERSDNTDIQPGQ